MFNKILVSVGNTELPASLTHQLIEIARLHGSEVFLIKLKTNAPPVVAVNTCDQFPLMTSPAAVNTLDSDTAKTQGFVEKLSSELVAEGIRVEKDKGISIYNHDIAKYAREKGVDLIVMTAQVYKGWKRLVLGSTVEDVLRESNIPLLVINQQTPEGINVD